MSTKKNAARKTIRRDAPAKAVITTADALYAFANFLTGLPVTIPVGGAALSTPVAELVARFVGTNNMGPTTEGIRNVKHPEVTFDVVQRLQEAMDYYRKCDWPVIPNEAASNPSAPSGRDEVDSRRVTREAPGPHFVRVAKMWSALCGHRIDAEMAVLMMVALKLAREAGGHEIDNMVDAEGYSSLHHEVREYEITRDTSGGR